MNISAGADFHGRLPDISNKDKGFPIDILILAGDMYPHNIRNFHVLPNGKRLIHGTRESEYQTEWALQKMTHWVEALKPKAVVHVAGNHDFLDPADLPFITHGLKEGSATVSVEGLKIGLLGGTVRFLGEWQDEVTEKELKSRILGISPDIDILVSHIPPYGIMDKSLSADHIGSTALSDAILGYEPHFTNLKYHIFGHCHESRGTQVEHKTTFKNVATSGKKPMTQVIL